MKTAPTWNLCSPGNLHAPAMPIRQTLDKRTNRHPAKQGDDLSHGCPCTATDAPAGHEGQGCIPIWSHGHGHAIRALPQDLPGAAG